MKLQELRKLAKPDVRYIMVITKKMFLNVVRLDQKLMSILLQKLMMLE